MKRNIVLLFAIVAFSIFFYGWKKMVFTELPGKVHDLEETQIVRNEQLITAQILSESMERVYTIFERNIVPTKTDGLKRQASMEFLNYLTGIMDTLEVEILHMKPKPTQELVGYFKNPYELEIKCSYEKFGMFITELEKSDHIIMLDNYELKNGLEKLVSVQKPEDLVDHIIEMELSTITMLKSRG